MYKRNNRKCYTKCQLSYIITMIITSAMSVFFTSAFMIEMTGPMSFLPQSSYSNHRRGSELRQRKYSILSMSKDKSNDEDTENCDEENRLEKQSGRDKNNNDFEKILKDNNSLTKDLLAENADLVKRIIQLEALAGSQAVEIRKLREECKSIKEAAEAFAQVVDLLRQAGLSVDQSATTKPRQDDVEKTIRKEEPKETPDSKKKTELIKEYQYLDEAEIFGSAPASVTDAADAAGASILAALLAGKHRMLVDVRDAELSRDQDVLVQFIELAILPVAAGLEGLKTQKNRVKIVFPTVSQLMEYRRTMALAAPEVVSLSTLGFDPVEKRDNLVVIVAPAPDDEEGLMQMNDLLSSNSIRQPVVVLNHHMVPLEGPGGLYDPIYHLRLLTVQYMAGDALSNSEQKKQGKAVSDDYNELTATSKKEISNNSTASNLSLEKEDAALAAAMEHAHELGVHQGVTRAMVIRAYPRPWHVFVDTSPDTDADFEVAATFDEYPTQDDINYAIVECLEGSEREDELVAQQMQEAIESGQLTSISDVLGLSNIDKKVGSDEEEEDDDFYNDWDPWHGTDTV